MKSAGQHCQPSLEKERGGGKEIACSIAFMAGSIINIEITTLAWAISRRQFVVFQITVSPHHLKSQWYVFFKHWRSKCLDKLTARGRKQSLWIISVVKACRPLTSHLLFNHLYFRRSAPHDVRWLTGGLRKPDHSNAVKKGRGQPGVNVPSLNWHFEWIKNQ